MFWDNFISLCTKVGKSPSAVAKEIGLSNGVTTAWRNGTTPRNAVVQKLADYFNVPVEVLLEGESGHRSIESYSEVASILKACDGLSDAKLREVRHYIEFLKTQE